jgi:predicted dehydrogenase
MVDLLLWLTKDRVLEVAAYGNNIASRPHFKYNDMVVAILRFKSGLAGKVAVNFGCVRPHFHRVALYGTKATFLNECEENALIFTSRDRAAAPQKIHLAYPGVRKDALIRSFIDSILKGSPAAVTEDDAFRAMSVCFAIEESAAKRRPVKVEYI